MTKPIRLAAIGVGAALALGGCGSSGSSAGGSSKAGGTSASQSSTHQSPDASVTHAELASIARTYDKQNSVAISKALNRPYDAKAWRAVDSGPILARDTYDTKGAALKKSKHTEPSKPQKMPKILRAYGSSSRSSDGRTPWVMSVMRGAKSTDMAGVYVKATNGWRLDADFGGIDPKLLPAEKTTVPSLTAAQRQSAANAVPVVVDAVATGDMKDVTNSKPLLDYRKAFQVDGHSGLEAGATCRPWGTELGTDVSNAVVVGTDALRLTRVGSRTLAVLNLDCQLAIYAKDGGQVQIPKDNARIEGDDGKAKESAIRRSSLMLLMSIPDEGKPKIIASSGAYLVPSEH